MYHVDTWTNTSKFTNFSRLHLNKIHIICYISKTTYNAEYRFLRGINRTIYALLRKWGSKGVTFMDENKKASIGLKLPYYLDPFLTIFILKNLKKSIFKTLLMSL